MIEAVRRAGARCGGSQHGHSLLRDDRGADPRYRQATARRQRQARGESDFRRLHNTTPAAKTTISDQVVAIPSRPDAVFADNQLAVSGAKGCRVLETGEIDAGLIWAGQI